MTIKIQVRDAVGKYIYRDSQIGEFARISMETILDDGKNGREDGWWWLRQCICSVLIHRAQKNLGNPVVADRWFARYQAIRGIE